mgnify:CR=1 FL=1
MKKVGFPKEVVDTLYTCIYSDDFGEKSYQDSIAVILVLLTWPDVAYVIDFKKMFKTWFSKNRVICLYLNSQLCLCMPIKSAVLIFVQAWRSLPFEKKMIRLRTFDE